MADKPRLADLRTVLEKVVSAQISTRIEGLSLTLQWYDLALDYCIDKGKLDATKLKKQLEKATKTRDLGVNNSNQHEKESAFRKSVGFYQQICEQILSKNVDGTVTPSVEEYYKQYEDAKAKLEAQEASVNAKYAPILDLLKGVFKNTGFNISIDPSASEDRWFDGAKEIRYSRTAAKEIRETLRVEGLFPAMKKEMMLFSRAKGFKVDAQGQLGFSAETQVKALSTLLDDFVSYVRANNTFKLIKDGQVIQQTAAPAAVKNTAQPKQPTQKKPKAANTGSKIGDYAPGTPMFAIYEKLKSGKSISKKDLYSGLGTSPHTFFAWIKIHGTKSGKWTIEESGGNVKMVMT